MSDFKVEVQKSFNELRQNLGEVLLQRELPEHLREIKKEALDEALEALQSLEAEVNTLNSENVPPNVYEALDLCLKSYNEHCVNFNHQTRNTTTDNGILVKMIRSHEKLITIIDTAITAGTKDKTTNERAVSALKGIAYLSVLLMLSILCVAFSLMTFGPGGAAVFPALDLAFSRTKHHLGTLRSGKEEPLDLKELQNSLKYLHSKFGYGFSSTRYSGIFDVTITKQNADTTSPKPN